MSYEIKFSELEEITDLAELDYDCIDATYSGRGMYGRFCLAINSDDSGDPLKFAIAAGQVLGYARAVSLFGSASTDSMGRGLVTYFPGVNVDFENGS
jgi:hypothetical protein